MHYLTFGTSQTITMILNNLQLDICPHTKKNSFRNFTELLVILGNMEKLEII